MFGVTTNREFIRTRLYNPAVFACLAVIVVCALPLFSHLDEPPIQVWDEMRNAQNALEMNTTGKIIVTTFDYHPETWNTKPPLMIWILALSQRILGYNELAIRLPSALAALFTCLLLVHFVKRRTGSWLPGLITVLVLVTTRGYVTIHGTRTGDYDALLSFFITASAICFVNFIEEQTPRWLWLSTISIIAAILTKGVAGLFICPAMLAYVLFRNKSKLLFLNKHLYACLALFVLIIGGYYYLREVQQPGYLQVVWINELGGRYNSALETHQGDYWTYYRELKNTGFSAWILFIVPALLAGIFSRDKRIKSLVLFSALSVLSIFITINIAATKLSWYLMPLYPFLALICGLFIYQCFELIKQWKEPDRLWSFNFLPILFILAIGFAPYDAILDTTMGGDYPILSVGTNDAGLYLKEVIAGSRVLNATVMCGDPYALHWYGAVINRRGGRGLYELNPRSLDSGMTVLTWEDPIKDYIRRYYVTGIVEDFHSVTIFSIAGKKADSSKAISWRPSPIISSPFPGFSLPHPGQSGYP